MQRRTAILALLCSALLSQLLLAGIFARASDSVTSSGNHVLSGTFTPPAHDVQAAQGTTGTFDCATATYGNGPFAFVTQSTANLNAGGGSGTSRWMCVKNTGTAAGKLVVRLANIVDTEVNACEPGEAAVNEGGDTSCANGALGELSPLMNFSLAPSGTSTGTCTGGFGTLANMQTAGITVATALAPGEYCRLIISGTTFTQFNALTEAEKSRAQTDKATFDVLFTLEDAA